MALRNQAPWRVVAALDEGGVDAGVEAQSLVEGGTADAGASHDVATEPDASDQDASTTDAASDAGFVTAQHHAWPVIHSQGGPVVTSPDLVALLPQNHPYAAQLGAFSDAVPQSAWWAAVSAEYGLGTMTSTVVTGPAMTGAFTDANVTGYVQGITPATPPLPTGTSSTCCSCPPP